MDSEKERFGQLAGTNSDFACERVVFLVNEKEFDDEEKEHLKNAEFIRAISIWREQILHIAIRI